MVADNGYHSMSRKVLQVMSGADLGFDQGGAQIVTGLNC